MAVLLFFNANLIAQSTWQSEWVNADKNGKLIYKADSLGNSIPDFSRVGYRQGREKIPHVPVVKVVMPDGLNDEQLIQAAIDELALKAPDAYGIRGAVLLKKGTYKIKGNIRITTGGIVLRGEGLDTRLVAVGKGQRNLISVTGKGAITELPGSRQTIANDYVPVGSFSFSVQNASQLKAGDRIIVRRPGTGEWIHDIKMDEIEVRDSGTKQWLAKDYDLLFERTITKVQGNKIYIDNPIVMAMGSKYGGGEIYRYHFDGRISQVGVENLLCLSEYSGEEDEDHGWTAVFMNRVEDAWVSNVESRHFGYSCVNLGWQSKQVTVDRCRSIDPKSKITGSRRYSFNNDGQLNLFMNCFASNGRHDYITGAKTLGPNVFYNCRAEKAHADIGPHHRWAVGTLYDNIFSDGEINIQDRGNWGTGHGWSGITQVLWNCTAAKICVQSPWASGKNYAIGVRGEQYNGRLPGRPNGEWEGHNKTGLQPASLYQAQLKASGN